MMTQFDCAAAAVHVATICQLARDARAERNTAALEFLGKYLKPLLPESALEAFRDELKRIPARTVEAPKAPDVVTELQAYQAARDGVDAKREVVRKAVASTAPAVTQVLRNDINASIDF
jgi:hypothetical protein